MKIGYARKSRDRQDLGTQLDLLTKAGVALDDIYSDSESGATRADTRPGYAAMQAHIASAVGVTDVVVTEFSRLGRDARDSIYEMLSLARQGIHVVSLAENETFISEMPAEAQIPMIAMMAMGADIERKHISERTRWSLARIKTGQNPTKSGRPVGRPRVEIDWRKLERLMARHGINETAARKLLGYHEATFYRAKRRLKANPTCKTPTERWL